MEDVFLLVESSSTGTGKLVVDAVVRQGLRPVLLTARPKRYSGFAAGAVVLERCDTDDVQALVEHVARRSDTLAVRGVGTVYDYYVPAAAAVAAALSLPGPDPQAARWARHKHQQRITLATAGVPQPQFQACRTVADALAAADRITYPVICKPVSGSGSTGVRLCTDAVELERHAASWLAMTRNHRGVPIEPVVLVEEFVRGRELSVEMFDGVAVAACDKHVTGGTMFVETGHATPSTLPPDVLGSACRIAQDAVRSLGLRWGPCHVELLTTPAGRLAVVEVNQRLAGDLIPALVARASGIDLVAAYVDRCLGRVPRLERNKHACASVTFVVSDELREKHAVPLDRVRAVEGVFDVALRDDEGDGIRFGDTRDRIGHFAVHAPSRDLLLAREQRARQAIGMAVATPSALVAPC